MKTLLRLGSLMMLIGVMAAPAFAQVPAPEVTTSWTIDEPTLVGETVLQPGTYRVEVVARPENRNIVRVLSTDGQTLYTTVLTIPHTLDPDEERPSSMFVFYPAAPGEPRALRTWYPANPPSGDGHDIVYDADHARALAARSKTRVVAYPATVETADLGTTELQVVTPEARVETYVVPETRTTIVETKPVETEPVMVAETRTELPQTAGNTPLLALLGLLAIAGAFAIRVAIR